MNTFGEIAAGILGAGIGPAFPRALTAEPGAAIRIDDADLIFKGDYARAGRDLVISHDGKQLVVHDYFAPENLVHGRPASLRGPNGAGLEGDIVAGLAKAGTPDVFAQAGPAPTSDASAAIGRVQTLTGSATAMRNGVSVTLHVGDLVYKGDVLQTDGGSSLAVSFLDGTLFSLGASARMLLNEMVYSANGAGNASMFSLVQGSITFVAGQVAKSGDMKVGTPVATMGIRGTAVHVTIEADNGTTAFSVMTEPDGHTGRFDVYDRNDPSKLLFTVSDPGVSTVVRPDGPFQVTFEQVAKSPAETAAEIAIVQTLFRTVAEAPRLPVFQGPQTGGGAGSSTAPNLVLPDPAAPPAGPNGGGGAPGTSQQPQSAPGSGPGTAPPRDDDRPTQPVVPPAEEQPRLVLEPRNGTVAQDAALVAATATQGLLGPVLAGTPRPVSIVSAHAGGNLDDPGAPLTGETILLRGLYGVLSLARDGTYVYLADRAASLAAGQHGSDVFAFRAADGTGQASALLTIDVVGVNDAPVRTAPLHLPAVEDGGPVILTAAELLAGVTDVDGDALSVTALHVASGGGTLTDLGGGRYRYTPAGAHGSDQPVVLAYTVSDGHGGTLAETVELALPFHNTVPALAGPVTLANSAEDTARIVTVAELLAGASDADGDALSVAGLHVTSGGGTLTDLGNGTYRYTPAADANGPVVLGYTITDGFGGTVAQIASFAVTPVNDAPVLTLPDRTLGYVEDAAPLAVAADVAVADVDSPMLRGATIRVAAGFHAGEDTLAVTLAAGSGLTAQYDQATGTLTLAGLATLAAYSAALASVTYHNDSQAPSAETRVIAFTVIDDAGLESAAVIRSVTVTPVNDAPTVSGAVTLADSAEDTSRIISAAELLAGARDVDGDTLSVLGLHVASGGGTLADLGNGLYRYTPAADANGPVVLGYTIGDGHGGSVAQTASFTVTPVNDAPTVSGSVTLADSAEDTSRIISAAELLAGARDVDGDTLSVLGLHVTSGGGTLTDLGNGTYRYTPAADANGPVVLGYTIGDGHGGSVAQTASFTVTPVNDAPTVSGSITLADSAEDTSRIISAAELLAGARDVDGDTLSVLGLHVASGGGTLADLGNGLYRYTPAADANGPVVLGYTIGDGHGGSVAQTASFTVTPVNDAPRAQDDNAFVNAGDEVRIAVLANDTDVDGDALTVSVVGAAGHGTLHVNADGTITYRPATGYFGVDSFVYEVADPSGATSRATVDIIVGMADHQTVGDDVFLQGAYMEIGVSKSGSLGSASAAPGNFHPQGSTGISFVVDTDGWNTGAMPTSNDVTLPGTPEDAIVIAHDGRSFANSERTGAIGFSAVTTDTSSGSRLQATTVGTSSDGLHMKQVIDLDPNASYFSTTVTFTNTSGAAMQNVRFMRSFDPDQDALFHGDYSTNNDVLANPTAAGGGGAIVQALGTGSGVSVNLVAFDPGARASSDAFTNHNAYARGVYDAPSDPNGAHADIGIALNIDFGTLAPGETATRTFYTTLNTRSGANDLIIGSDGNDVIDGLGGDDIIIGLGGDDVLTGGSGNDTFVFMPSGPNGTVIPTRAIRTDRPQITDFTPGADHLQFDHTIYATVEAALAGARQTGADVVFDYTVDSVHTVLTLRNVLLADLHARDIHIV
ncbi:hypothetical protein AOPFMNJM_0855 [Methylobacterium jeotgali]|uniref:Tandem-95 repeat protein n=1 Tax=Methylobacterium jeotgali TaxID=381630 RepID=A0ABQ4SUK8_9HYPH|nr:cadherin-like domain-containing protein [Methylobacterium jeotgali]GJE05553.1 hypothetical protein AOPFMNJM_0855 [Methylobacterium jeotgali]